MRKAMLNFFGVFFAALLLTSGIWHDFVHHAMAEATSHTCENASLQLPCTSDAHHFHARHLVHHNAANDQFCPVCAGMLQCVPPDGTASVPAAPGLRVRPPHNKLILPRQTFRLPQSRAPPTF